MLRFVAFIASRCICRCRCWPGTRVIVSLNRHLEKQKNAELMPDAQRREELRCDTALTRWANNVCFGCERAVIMKNPDIDFCLHCGSGLFDHCRACNSRKSGFATFCCASPRNPRWRAGELAARQSADGSLPRLVWLAYR